jgi:TPR repeat protein
MLDGFGLYPSEIIVDLDSYAGPSSHVWKFENRRGWLVAADLFIESEGEFYNYQILAACDEYGNAIKSFQAAHLTECGCSFPRLCEEVPPAELNEIVADEVEWAKRRWLREADADMRDLHRANEALILQLEHQLDRRLKNLDRQISDLRRMRRMGEASSDDNTPYLRLIAECEAQQDLEISEFRTERQRIRDEFAELERRALSKLWFKVDLEINWIVNWIGSKRPDYETDCIFRSVLSSIEAHNEREGSFGLRELGGGRWATRIQRENDHIDRQFREHDVARNKLGSNFQIGEVTSKLEKYFSARPSNQEFGETSKSDDDSKSDEMASRIAELLLPAETGDTDAQCDLGWIYSTGDGVEPDPTEGVKWYRAAAENGSSMAQYNLGIIYKNGHGVAQDYAEASRWYRMAAEQGDADAQYNLGFLYDHGQGVAQDYTEASRWYRMAAEQGNSAAQYNLGLLYDHGQGVAQDYTEASRWYRMAAEQGDADAQYNLGFLYDHGQGVAQDYVEASRWYRMAAEQGNADAQYNVGVLYYSGHGVAQDYAEASRWFRMAAEQGNADAQFQTGQAYRYGLGVLSDWLEAVVWYRRAAEQEHLDAQFRLYQVLKGLKSFPNSSLEANVWLTKAADNGHIEAQSVVQALAPHSVQAASLQKTPSTEGTAVQSKPTKADGAGSDLLSRYDDEAAGKMYVEMPRCPSCNQKVNETMRTGQRIKCPSCNERWVPGWG